MGRTIIDGDFEWDEEKNEKNIKSHGISFKEAKYVFDDINCFEVYDSSHSAEEDRFRFFGDIGGFVIVVVVFIDRNGRARIISARPAEPEEKEMYYEYIQRKIGRNQELQEYGLLRLPDTHKGGV